MNKIYKIIWSRTKNCYVVASELAKSHTKGATTSSSSKGLKGSALATAVLATVAVSALGVQSVQAEASTVGGQAGIAITKNGASSTATAVNTAIAIGESTVAQAANSIVIGNSASALGFKSTVTDQVDNTIKEVDVESSSAVVIGNNAKTLGGFIVSIGDGANTSGNGSVSIGYTASSVNGGVAVGSKSKAMSDLATAFGPAAQALADRSMAIGASSKADGEWSAAIGVFSKSTKYKALAVGTSAEARGLGATSIGSDSVASGNGSIALGAPTVTITESTADTERKVEISNKTVASGLNSFAAGNGAQSNGTGSIAIGSSYTKQDGTVLNTTAANDYTIAIGAGAQTTNPKIDDKETGNNQIAIGNAALTKGYGGIALGSIVRNAERDGKPIIDKQTTAGENSIALGSAAQAAGRWSMALGYLSNTSESIDSIAVGYSSAATADQALSVGPIYYFREISGSTVNDAGKIVYESTVTPVVSKAAAQYATALGAGSQATAYMSLAVGTGAVASGSRAIAIGGAYNSRDKSDVQTQATGLDSMAFGNGAIAQGSYSVAIGRLASVTNGALNEENSQGTQITLPDGSKVVNATGAVALGEGTKVNQRYAISIGNKAGVTGVSGIAIGVNSSTAARSAVSIGDQAEADSINAVALGNFAKAKAKVSTVTNPDGSTSTVTTIASSAIAIGDNAHAYDQYTIAIGRSAAATANTAIAIGDKANASGSGSIAIGSTASSAGQLATALGPKANASAPQSIAIGNGAQGAANMGIAIGSAANAGADRSVVVGQSAGSDKKFGTVVGVWSKAQGDSAVALGAMAKASGKRSIAIGGSEPEINKNNVETMEGAISTAATGENSVAMGYGATATYDNSVALGSNATTDAAVGTASATIAGKTVNFAGTTPVGTVSVGKSGVTTRAAGDGPEYRTITNVAAGRISADSTDAINGSQLYAVNDALTNLVQSGAGSVTYVDGEGKPVVEIGGKYYPEGTKTDDKGHPVQADGKTPAEEVKTPVSAGTTTPNSGLGLPLGEDAKAIEPAEATTIVGGNGKDGLLGAKGADLSKVATVADLQAVAQAGLDFTGDTVDAEGNKVVVHRPLSKTLAVTGGADVTKLTDNNIGVVADAEKGLAIKLAKDIDLADGSVTTKGYQDTDGNPLVKGEDGKYYPEGALDDLTYNPETGKYVDDQGNTLADLKDVPLAKENEAVYDGNGTTVTTKDSDGNVLGKTTVGADGLTVAGKDGEDGKTVVGKDGITITPAKGEDGTTKAPVSLTDKGLDNGGNKITNVAAGTDPTDAVNFQQYQDLKDAVDGIDGNSGSKLVDGKGNEVVKIGDNYYPADTKVDNAGKPVQADGKTPATPIDTTQNPISAVTEAPNSGLGLPAGTNGDGSDDPNTGKTPAIGADTAKTVVGGNGRDGDPGKDGLLGASGADLSKLATVGDLQALAQAGLDFTGDTVDAEGKNVVVHRPLSKTLAVTGGADVTKLTDNNIGVVADAEKGLVIKLAKDIDLADGSVTTKGYQDTDGNPLVKGEDGKYYPEGALDDLTYNPETGKYVDDQGNTPADLKDVPLAKENEAVYDGNGTTVTTKDPDGNALGKTTVGADGITVAGKDGKDGKTVVGKDGITITPAKGEDGTTKAPVSLTDKGLDNGGNPISNVGPGTKPTDAATLGQVQELAGKVGAADELGKVDEEGDKVISVGDKDYKVDENGNPVDEKGNPLVKGDDGKYYPPEATKDDDGNMVVPDGNGGTKPAEEAPSSAKGDTSLASDADKSGLGLPIGTNGDGSDDSTTGKTPAIDEEKAKTVVGGNGRDGDPGKDGLLGASGADLSKLATVGDLQALAQAGLDFDGDAGTYVHRPLSKKLTVYGEADTENLTAGNIGVVANGKDSLALKLAKDINLPNGSVTTTNYQTNEAGNVVDADSNPLTQGDDGKWYKADDVKGLTYDPANNQYVDKDGKPATLTEGTPVETGNAVYNGDGIDVTDKDGNNTKVTGEGVTAKDKDGNTTTVKGNGITVAGKDGENGKTVIGKDGITITPENGKTVSLTDKGLDNGGNQVKGVGDATEDSDAVNYKQLKDLAKELAGGSGLGLVDKDGNKVVKGDDGNYYPVDENGNPVVADEEGNPLVKVGDEYYNPDNLAKDDQGNIITNDDGKPVSKDDNTMPATPSEPVKAEGTTISSNTDSSALGRDLGDDAKAITAENGEDGTPGATELIGGKDDGNGNKTGGLLQAEGSDLSKLATKGDLQAVAQAGLNFQGNDGEAVHAPLSDTVHIVGDYDKTKTSLVAGNIGVTNIDDKLTIQLAKDINLGNDGSIKLGDKVNLDGDTGLTVKGDDGKEANYGSDGSTIKDGKGNENKSTAGGNTITDGDGNKTETKADGVTTSDGKGNSSSLTPEGTTVTDANGNQTKVGPDGITIGDSKGNTYVTINENGLSGKEGAPVDFGNGLNVPGALTVKPESKDADGNTLAPVIDANGNRIQNVGTGILPTDAVNVGQLNGVKHDLNSRMNVIGAHAAAMAALHPMEFANGEKTSIAAGIGTFQSKQAMAIGAFYRPNDDTMFSVGGSFGSSENMFNVGVSLRLGADGDENKYEQKYRKAPLSTIAVLDDKVDALEQENTALKDSVAASNAENASLKQEVAGQKAELQAQRQELEAQREQIKLLMERLGM